MNKTIRNILTVVIALIAINVISSRIYQRFDLTADKRYTISTSAIAIIETIDSPILVDVFLEGEEFPAEFRRLQKSVQDKTWKSASQYSCKMFL